MQNDYGVWGQIRRGIPKNWPMDSEGKREQPALLTNLPEGPLADMTRNMLEAYGIPVMEAFQEDGTFARVLFGASAYGVGLFVPASRQAEARALLEAAPGAEKPENTPEDGK
jgi:hypothetical protein